MEYSIVQAYTEKGLVELVNELIKEGWRPVGGVSSIYIAEYRGYEFYQALIKESLKITPLNKDQPVSEEDI